jgi:electron transfer flavoprotein alpha subunit
VHALAGLVEEHRPDLILFPSSYDARDVAGRLQVRTGSTLMANATDVLGADKARTEILGGTKVVDVDLQGPSPKLVLVRPQSFVAEPSGGTAEVVEVSADVPDDLKTVERIERHEEKASGPRLEDAKVVVAGGRGLGGTDAFEELEKLASAIGNAAVGASRAAVDAGWVPYSYQIGQTGRTVKPEVYLCAGISGALQHLVGMKGAKRIVAITKDADAPILKIADLGVVGDLFKVVPALTEEIEKRRTAS